MVWIVEPELHIVDVYRQNGVNRRLRETDELSGEDVLPGFRCRVAELFPELPWRPNDAADGRFRF